MFSGTEIAGGAIAATLVVAAFCAGIAWHQHRMTRLLMASLHATRRARQIVGGNGRARFANAPFGELFGEDTTPMPDLLRARAWDEDGARALDRILAGLEERGEGSAEISIRGEGGKREILEVMAQRLRGYFGYVLWGAEVVTARREMEEYIRSDHEKFADLIENAPIGFYSVDEAGRFLFVNATLARWLGLPVEAETGQKYRLRDVLADPPLGGAPHVPFADPAQRAGEVRLKGGNGRIFTAYIRQDVAMVRERGHSGLRTRSIVHDLERERELERAVKESEQYFRRFFEEAPGGIALLGADRRLERANAAFQALCGEAAFLSHRGGKAALGTPFPRLVHEEDRPVAERHFDLAERHFDQADRKPTPPITVRLESDGERSVSIQASSLEEHGRLSGFIVHASDMTEQKRLEAQFVQSQKMQAVGLLAGGIAHDFNNLLTAMIGFCDLLLLRHRAGDQSFADIMQIKQNSNRAANLVRQLLAFSRQQTLQPRVLQVTDVLAEVSHLLRRLIGENIEMLMNHGRDLHAVRADQGQLEQVIINLAVNARDAMPKGGQLRINTQNVEILQPVQRGVELMPAGHYVMIEVADSGTGIPPEILDRIFEPFFSTKAVGSGTGLGLSTVYGIVRQTGGYVFVDSVPGQGTAFGVYLPRHELAPGQQVRQEGAEEAPRDLTGIGTVLIVEDEDAVRLFSARALRNKGYQVLEARSGEAALEIIGEHLDEIDLIISDVVMPRVDGPTLINEVRARRADLPVIFISGYAEDAFRRKVEGGEEAHFLMKPFTLKQLAAKVKEVLSEKR